MDNAAPAGLTPAAFHAKSGVADHWRVTSWGPQACFSSTSLRDAAQLIPVIVQAADELGTTTGSISHRGRTRTDSGGAKLAP